MLSRTWQIRQVFISMSRCRGFESITLTQIKNLDKSSSEHNYCRNLCPALLPPRLPVNLYDRIILLLSVVEFLFSVSPENVWHLCNISNFILIQN